MDEQIRKILQEYANLSGPVQGLGDDADLYQAGLTSHATVNVMLAIEDEFEIEFPEAMLRKSTFQSLAAIRQAVSQLLGTTVDT